MVKPPKERKVDQRKRDRMKGIIHRSVKVKIEVYGSIKKISKEKNKTIDEVFDDLLSQSLEHQEEVKSKKEINEDLTSDSNQSNQEKKC